MTMRIGIALGSNLGERLDHLRAARTALYALPEVRPPCLASALYETEPVDCEPGAEPFLNAVVEINFTGRDPQRLLPALKNIEQQLGRTRGEPRNRSRTIDLDILYADDQTSATPCLTIPHPRAHLRRFVLEPLADLHPSMILPGQTQPVLRLLAHLPHEGVVRLSENW